VEPGTTVAANFQTPNLFEIASDTSRMQVEASVDEADIGQVKEGQPVRFTVDSYPDETFLARVQQIRKSANEAQNAVSYLVILDVDNKDGKLLTGMTANVEIETGRKTDVLRIPTSATRFRPRPEDQPADEDEDGNSEDEEERRKSDGTFVWLKSEDAYKPTEKKISIGLVGEDFTEVKKGLSATDVILLRVRNLSPEQGAEQ
jgi:HlyD family secretion protein